ncbi:hypothetical protein D088_680043 [Salmonella enterica subsp. houtenae serovar 16:z4,z32:-- str. RKS3027]|nr:hypothetical protein D088_680043 [Salmonella enterica subsp. houtenae serovar 16:z4,z32:-- str. RKS3027]
MRFDRPHIPMPSRFVYPILITFPFRALFTIRFYLFLKLNHYL